MEAEERPQKLRKLGNGQAKDSDGSSGISLPSKAATGESTISTDPYPKSVKEQNGSDSSKSDAEDGHDGEDVKVEIGPTLTGVDQAKPLSKNQLKKLRRDELWEAGREDRKAKRKQKAKEKKERRRTERLADRQQRGVTGGHSSPKGKQRLRPTLLPVTLLLDCQFNDLMNGSELVSLGSQLTRCYSDNHRAPFQAHLVVSSWGGTLKDRFDTALSRQYENWKGIDFVPESFMEAAKKAKDMMEGPKGGAIAGALASNAPSFANGSENATDRDMGAAENITSEELPPLGTPGEIVYLTSDSPYTLRHLAPKSTYIIGGLVDKNRHKGICYRLARDAGADTSQGAPLRTAKLPIGEYMSMQSRTVLATNHVCEIMIRWLECGDWGEAFTKVMPKRKGATLKDQKSGQSVSEGDVGVAVDEIESDEYLIPKEALARTGNSDNTNDMAPPSHSISELIDSDSRKEKDQEIMESVVETSANLFAENTP